MGENKQELEDVRVEWAARGKYWDQRADEAAKMADRLNRPLIEACDIQLGHKVIDLASGAGEPALTVAKIVGSEGHVSATDLVPEMLAGARRRFGNHGVENVDFRIADMADLPHESLAYDRAISRFGLMFSPRKQQAVDEIFRVLKPGGRVAYMVWGPLSNNTVFSAIRDAKIEIFGDDHSMQEFDRPFSLSASGAMKMLLENAGFSGVEEVSVRRNSEIPAGLNFWEPMVDMTAGNLLENAGDETRAKFGRAVEQRCAELLVGDVYRVRLHAIIGVGTKFS